MTYATQETCENVQANILRATKFKEKQPRDWSLFFFFRILHQAEFDVMIERMEGALTDDDSARRELWQDFAETTLVNAELVEQRLAENFFRGRSRTGRQTPSRRWLKAIVWADNSGIKKTADLILNVSPPPEPNGPKKGPIEIISRGHVECSLA